MNRFHQLCLSIYLVFVVLGFSSSAYSENLNLTQKIDVVAELTMRPGNVTATSEGRVFATIHPMGGEFGIQLVEIIEGKAIAWPSSEFQAQPGRYADEVFDSPLGITKDKQGGIWVVDSGLRLGKARVWGFDIETGELIAKLDIASDQAPQGAFVQDLVVDRKNGWAYLAATGTQSILAVNLATGDSMKFSGHESLQPDEDARLMFNGKELHFFGNPARVGINPITLSDDGEALFYGSMTGFGWFSVPAKLFRDGATHHEIAAAIKRVGEKPISDGATTDAKGNHYFTNLMASGIDRLDNAGNLTPIIRDQRFAWPDNVQIGEPNTLYIAVNQLHTVPAATGGLDRGQAPYYIYRVTLP